MKLKYRAFFFALSWNFYILRPFISWILPINKDIVIVSDIAQKINEKTQYPVPSFINLVKQHGYIPEEYLVQTTDGYQLKLHRICGSTSNPKKFGKPVAYLQHGMLLSSDSFVLIGPDSDLAFQLVDAGYDVWLGNARGNSYSKSHVSKNPKDEDFWEFSHYEIAIYDVPEMIDRVLEVTKAKNLTYYGYSLGTTVSYIMLSTLPQYNEKINLMYSLAPAAFWKHKIRAVSLEILKKMEFIKEYFNYFKIYEIIPQTALAAHVGEKYCSDRNTFFGPICAFVTCKFVAMNYSKLNMTALPSILAHFPAGTSKHILFNYYQGYQYGKFQAYDWGKSLNLKKYNRETPPVYNLTNVRVPIIMWYANNDELVNSDDTKDLAKALPNVVSINSVDSKYFNHVDFMWALDAKKLVYDHIIKKLNFPALKY